MAAGLFAVVSLLFNPWRHDRPSERVPAIVQDVIVIALFAIAATMLLDEKVLTTSAVGAVVVGFALQDTLGNFFAGLAIQVEKPFRSASGSASATTRAGWRKSPGGPPSC